MAARVCQIDLTQPLPAVPVPRRYGWVWVLVKVGRRPVGWVKCRRSLVGDVLLPQRLRELIAEQLSLQAHDAIRARETSPEVVTEATSPADAQASLPTFSVIVCTREHPDVLGRQLESLLALEYPADRFEIVVVDNAPRTDGTRAVCERFGGRVTRIVEPRPGLDYARNAGWRAARGELVAYTDDDAVADPHWLTEIARNFADPRVACVTGITFPYELETPAQMHFERYGGMQRGFVRRVYRPGTWNTYFPLGSGRFGAGVNLALRRGVLEAMGGFDPALDVGSLARGGGDLDIMARALRDGWTLVYEPRAIVWHQHRQTMRQLRRQMFDYGFGFCAYLAKHASDLELGNQSLNILRKWSARWGGKRLWRNARDAAKLRPHFPVHLILLELLGGVLGLRAYGRSVNRVRSDAVRYGAPPSNGADGGAERRQRRASASTAAAAPPRVLTPSAPRTTRTARPHHSGATVAPAPTLAHGGPHPA